MPIAARLAPLSSLIIQAARRADADRRPSTEVMHKLGAAGLLRLVVPPEYGGEGIESAEFLTFVESLARLHGSTAWTAMTCNEEAGIASAYLEPDSMRGLFAEHPGMVIAGSGLPKGLAHRSAGGWTISGRWGFVSGCTAADRLVLTARVAGVHPIQLCFFLVDAESVTIEDTWHTHGLRGTGSNDVVVDELFVPDAWCGVIDNHSLPRPDTPFYRLPSGLRFPFPKVGVAAGLARSALDEFVAMAEGKRPLYHRGSLADRPSAQIAMADAEAKLSSARAWAIEMAEELWASSAESPVIDARLHARCRLACANAVGASIDAIETVITETGSSANFLTSPLGQLMADARAVAGHFTVGAYQKAIAGRVLLGLDADDPQF